ncbi:MAG: hypothetical protein KF833_14210 [Verrucomicrobiae bacterium]|nr:hypothetical protein [Verrucomicrobiae bacterium]
MLRIFLILSLAVALAGVVVSFVLKDKAQVLSEQRDTFRDERDRAVAAETRARDSERQAREAEKSAKDELELVQQELTVTTTRLNETDGLLARRSQELQETIVSRDTAQRRLSRWEALGIEPEQIANLQSRTERLAAERDAFAAEKQVMGREIARLSEELDLYRGKITEVQMPDVRGLVTAVDGNYQFVVLDRGAEDGLKRNGKMIITRGETLVAKAQLVRVEARSAVANLMPDWVQDQVQAGDQVMTSYEALPR